MQSSNYIRFAVDNRRFLSFGFLVALSSSFGQTFFIGVFGPGLREEFGLTHSDWGLVGGFNRSSQHVQFDWPASTGPELRREFSIRGSCGAVY